MEKSFVLPERKILVKPIVRNGGWLSSDHDGKFMYTGAFRGFTVPVSSQTNSIMNPLTEEEQSFFEVLFSMQKGEMSPYREKNNYWANKEVLLDKTERTLDLSNPKDYISYKILLSNKDTIAPSWDERNNKGSYVYALVDTAIETKKQSEAIVIKQKAYRMLDKITTHKQKMIDAIMVYRLGKRDYNKIADGIDKNTLYILLDDIISADAQGFVNVMTDKDYELKLAIQKMIRYKMVVQNPHLGNRYVIQDTELSGYPNELVEYLKEPANQELKAKLLMMIDKEDKKVDDSE